MGIASCQNLGAYAATYYDIDFTQQPRARIPRFEIPRPRDYRTGSVNGEIGPGQVWVRRPK